MSPDSRPSAPWHCSDPSDCGTCAPARARRATRLDTDWRFVRDDPPGAAGPGLDTTAWQEVTLPHTARRESLVTGPPGSDTAQWQGICWYRRSLRLDPDAGQHVALRFEGAMNVAEVFLDGEAIGGHLGGYLPFALDLTGRLTPGRDHLLAVRLDNRDNPITGPKPLDQLDFNLYHGLYRPVYLMQRDALHITEALLADRPGSGGVFVRYPEVSPERALVEVRVHVQNDRSSDRDARVRLTLSDPTGQVVARARSPLVRITAGRDAEFVEHLAVEQPLLWSPQSPALHLLEVELISADGVADAEIHRIGIRRFDLESGGLRLNGEPIFLRGTNRHQEYPWVGYALPDAGQWRDAQRIKAAGFDYVRLSHYPHAPAFMDACDALGLVTMNCIPGWQYFNPDPAFVALQERNARDLFRRDRNRPSVALWEVSLNESPMPAAFVARMQAIAHEEYPGDQCHTAGWMPGYDVRLDARQHGGCRHPGETACLVSEYGDWEYYAMNAGLDQDAWQDLSPAESNSRQLRWQGERALRQQAANFQEAHNDNLATAAIGDGLWVMYDYNRGYAPDIESSGCADIMRLPKYSWHFFRSQRDPDARLPDAASGPMVFIASDWQPGSDPKVRVFSNCDEVLLTLDGRELGRRGPDRDRMSTRLAHPPFTFPTAGFRPGRLEAVGLIGGRAMARHAVETAGAATRLALEFDLAGRERDPDLGDLVFCRALLLDAVGNTVRDGFENVAFGVSGAGRLVGDSPLATEAGIASTLVATPPGTAPAIVHALAIIDDGDRMRILEASAATEGDAVPPQWVCYTTDGSAPGPTSARVVEPVPRTPALRAAVISPGLGVLTTLAADTPRFRIPANAAPARREPFAR